VGRFPLSRAVQALPVGQSYRDINKTTFLVVPRIFCRRVVLCPHEIARAVKNLDIDDIRAVEIILHSTIPPTDSSYSPCFLSILLSITPYLQSSNCLSVCHYRQAPFLTFITSSVTALCVRKGALRHGYRGRQPHMVRIYGLGHFCGHGSRN